MKLNLDEEKKNQILFILILIIAIIVRIISWPMAISQINVDEAMTAINAKTIAESGVDMYGTSYPVYLEAWGAMGQSVMLLYIMAFFIKLFGFSIVTIRLPMLLISIISIIIFYDFTKKIFQNKKIALIAMAFVSICPWHILQSMYSIDCNMFPHFMLISVYLLYCGITNKKWILYLSMIFFALTMYTYGVSIYVVPIFLLICAIYLFAKKQITIKNLILCIIIYLLFSFPILTMYVINGLKINTDICIGPITIQYFEANTRTSDMLFFSENFLTTCFNNIKSLAQTFFAQYDGLEWNATKLFGTMYHISIIFFLIGIIYFIKQKKEKNVGMVLYAIWLLISFILGIIINGVNINRINIIWFPTLFFTTYGIYKICEKNKKIKYSIIILYIILFISFSIYLYTVHIYSVDMSGCFSRKITDAVHYVYYTLNKKVVYYCNTTSMYVTFQDTLQNTHSEHIDNLETFESRLYEKQENEAFIIMKSELEKTAINIDLFEHEYFGDTVVIK